MSDMPLSRGRLVCAVGLFLLVLSGCGAPARVQHGNIEVFYTDGVTKAEADRLGAYLVKAWGAPADRRSVLLAKAAGGYQFRMVVKKEFRNDEKTLKRLEFDGARIARDVLEDAAVEVHACDEFMQTLKAFPPRADVRHGIVEGKAELFFAADVAKADAQRLASYMARLLKDAPAPVSFKLARRGAVVEVHMVCRPDLLNDPAIVAALRNDRNDLARNVFPDTTVEMHLCDDVFDVVQVLKP
jgi:hypothetical protein